MSLNLKSTLYLLNTDWLIKVKIENNIRVAVIKIIRLTKNEVWMFSFERNGTEKNLVQIRFLIEIKNKKKMMKFLFSENIICLNALEGSSIILPIVAQRSRLTTLSLRCDLQFSQVDLYKGF